jgi:hypothetical protein
LELKRIASKQFQTPIIDSLILPVIPMEKLQYCEVNFIRRVVNGYAWDIV